MVSDLNWIGEQALARLEQGAQEGLQKAADAILAESNRRAPEDEGDLKASGRAVADGNEAAVGYGAPYAVRQHEKLNYHHDSGQAKYLETAVHVAKDEALEAIAASIREALGG